ncbi:MAG: TPM domain-containing protein, partial [Lachnospiraceae bacterium]|nr:TPM domain-containing protein [Lachnospiraceae bacterium]
MQILTAIFSTIMIATLTLPKGAEPVTTIVNERTNPDTGYTVIVEDEADLLTTLEEEDLLNEMYKLTEYTSAAFSTTDHNPSSTSSYAQSFCHKKFGNGNGTVFVIDMDNRNIWIWSDGNSYRKITSRKADTITDNIYRYASKGEYYECSKEAFNEMYDVLAGQRIAQPMRYIGNALLALLAALCINYRIVIASSKAKKQDDRLMATLAYNYMNLGQPQAQKTHTTKVYNPPSSSSGGGGG